MDRLEYLVWFSNVFLSDSREKMWQIFDYYANPAEAYYEIMDGSDVFRFSEKEKNNMKSFTLSMAASIVEENIKSGIELIDYFSEKYPQQLKKMKYPPVILYCLGDSECLLDRHIIVSVGTRKPSQYSTEVTRSICSELARKNVTIASGFAVGTDVTSNLAAVDENKPTICVVAGGVDVNYPKANFKYRDMILESGGLFVSEHSKGTPSHTAYFMNRNMIMTHLGRASMIFEASAKSGSIVTADYTAAQGKCVFSMMPPDIFDDSYAGNMNLLRGGAIPIVDAESILSSIEANTGNTREIFTRPAPIFPKATRSPRKTEKPKIFEAEKPKKKAERDDISPLQKEILEILSEQPMHFDMLIEKLGISVSSLLVELTGLELSGEIQSMAGNMFRKI